MFSTHIRLTIFGSGFGSALVPGFIPSRNTENMQTISFTSFVIILLNFSSLSVWIKDISAPGNFLPSNFKKSNQ